MIDCRPFYFNHTLTKNAKKMENDQMIEFILKDIPKCCHHVTHRDNITFKQGGNCFIIQDKTNMYSF